MTPCYYRLPVRHRIISASVPQGEGKHMLITEHGRQNSTNQSFRGWLRRHEQAVTLVGAFIVFATFIVREEVRENLKDLVSSIETASAVFASRRDTSAVANQLNDIGTSLADISNIVLPGAAGAVGAYPDKASALVQGLRFRAYFLKNYSASLISYLDNIDQLSERITVDRSETKQSEELRNQVTQFQTDCETAIDHLQPWLDEYKTESDVFDKAFAKVVMPLIPRTGQLSDKIHKLGDDVLARANKIRREEESWFRLVSWLSIGLFAVGWALGVTAKLFGLEDATPQ
jgi:hypothetical protein